MDQYFGPQKIVSLKPKILGRDLAERFDQPLGFGTRLIDFWGVGVFVLFCARSRSRKYSGLRDSTEGWFSLRIFCSIRGSRRL